LLSLGDYCVAHALPAILFSLVPWGRKMDEKILRNRHIDNYKEVN
jgi:hypothetical protein